MSLQPGIVTGKRPTARDGVAQYRGDVHVNQQGNAHLGDDYSTNNNYFYTTGGSDELAFAPSRVFYYSTMHDRMEQIANAQDATCEWIWSSDLARWLPNPDERVFWMSGKPGSGKSTLIKYLSTTAKLHRFLPQTSNVWEVFSFYFDFRHGTERENSPEGLFRTLLNDLVQSRKDLLPKQFPGYREGEKLTVSTLEALFKFALDTIDINLIIFVDGLDEFVGNAMDMIKRFLLPLAHHKNVKLCLASRREAMMLHLLHKFPNLHISDPDLNAKGIQEYIRYTIEDFDESDLEVLQLNDVQQVIREKAEGVFLWVVLALAEIVEACSRGATSSEIRALIQVLPKDVEDMYDRILSRIPSNRKAEAAMLYTLVSDTRFRISLDLLRATLYFITHKMSIDSIPPLDLRNVDLEKRLIGSLGGLLEVCHSSSSRSTESYDGTPEVRLMHETVRAFSDRSQWANLLLPTSFKSDLAGQIWGQLCYNTISYATNSFRNQVHRIQPIPTTEEISYAQFRMLFGAFAKTDALQWVRLLYYSIKFVILQAEEDVCNPAPNGIMMIQEAMASPWSSLHTPIFERHIARRTKEFQMSFDETNDLTLAATHCAYDYLSMHTNRVQNLMDAPRYELVQRMLTFLGTNNCLALRKRDETALSRLERLRGLVDSILGLSSKITVLHLDAFLVLGYASMPRCLVKFSDGSGRLKQNLRMEPRPTLSFTSPYSEESPLFTWACEYTVEFTEVGQSPQSQLAVLLSFGVTIDEKSSEGYPILHYLIAKHVLEHTIFDAHDMCRADFEMKATIQKLYALEHFSADFKATFRSTTIVEILEAGIKRLASTPQKNSSKILKVDRVQLRLAQLMFMLRHKDETAHLPKPMVLEDPEGRDILHSLQPQACEICSPQKEESRASGSRSQAPAPAPEDMIGALSSMGFWAQIEPSSELVFNMPE